MSSKKCVNIRRELRTGDHELDKGKQASILGTSSVGIARAKPRGPHEGREVLDLARNKKVYTVPNGETDGRGGRSDWDR